VQDVALAYNAVLENEAMDAEWEGHMQDHFGRFFRAEDLAGARLQAAECRTTLCRVEVLLDNQDALAQLVHHVSGLLEPQAEGVLFREDDNALHVQVYLSRGGYTLPVQGLQSSP
jgi:hypothetical protein